jgi:hypothetical protein
LQQEVPGSINAGVVKYRNGAPSQMEVVIEPSWLFRTNGIVQTIDDDEVFSSTEETVEQFACSEATLLIIIITIIRITEIPNKDVSCKIQCNM